MLNFEICRVHCRVLRVSALESIDEWRLCTLQVWLFDQKHTNIMQLCNTAGQTLQYTSFSAAWLKPGLVRSMNLFFLCFNVCRKLPIVFVGLLFISSWLSGVLSFYPCDPNQELIRFFFRKHRLRHLSLNSQSQQHYDSLLFYFIQDYETLRK